MTKPSTPENGAPPGLQKHYPGDRIGVLLPLPLSGVYDYLVAENMTLVDGDFVTVPLGARRATGVVWGAGTGNVAQAKLKAAQGRLDCPPLPDVSRRFVDWVARYTLAQPGAVLKMAMSSPDALAPPKPVRAYVLNPDAPAFKKTKAREKVLQVMADDRPRLPKELALEAGTGTSVIKGLADAGVITPIALPARPDNLGTAPDWALAGPDLSPDQATAATVLEKRTEAAGFSVTLLDGVPGSGKTEVYFQAVAEALKQGGQVLVLLPEIALSAQWLTRFRQRFGALPGEWHSDLTAAQRRRTWRAVAGGDTQVIVGARSALFLPFPGLRLIVCDEEHDSSFKQEEGVIYNARDMAVVRAQLGGIPIVLASATPSLETVINADAGRYRLLHLPERHAGATLPEIGFIDMRKEKTPSQCWLSPSLREHLTATMEKGEQAMLFLNRRGYAPLTLCRTCGHRMQCPSCTAWLVEHRAGGRLLCHHCGFTAQPPRHCPECQKEDSFATCGPGVERLAEEVRDVFPHIRAEIAASDTLASPKAAAALIKRIEDHDIDLIIGTQIIAKGYHFPMLTLVGAVDADLGLGGGDLRAAERTYQLLYQVAGRAGRAERPGRVLLQTYMPEHPVMKALLDGDREGFLAAEAEGREQASMPPFGRLAALIVSGLNEAAVDDTALALGRAAPTGHGISVFGPAPAPFAMLRGKHRRRLLLKTDKECNLQAVIHEWLAQIPAQRKVRIQVDVDPYSFL
ncbi:MAG: primosomal protein N' [Proteobacteria bacterium]|nr:primosomal protein N' [Pseudomonadota bacterium]MDA1022932.1 primosomal protein N' [Pseudomonadota bacterium]